MLIKKDLNRIKEELTSCENPLFIFHDDGDGICSFLQCYLYKGKGSFEIVKKLYTLSKEYEYLIRKHSPDKVFVLDIPEVTQGFIDEIDVPIIWIDHHPILQRENILYINPRKYSPDKNYPVSYLCYLALRKSLWIGVLGSISDYHLPLDLLLEFSKKYPDLLSENIKNPGEALYKSYFGKLIQMVSLGLKNPKYKIIIFLEKLSKLKDPRDLTDLKDFFEKNIKKYEKLKKSALKKISEEKLFVFIYRNKSPFSADLANELIYLFPEKIILIAKEEDNEIKGSIRSRTKNILEPLKKSLKNISSTGGGHEFACGISIYKSEWEIFINNFKNNLKE